MFFVSTSVMLTKKVIVTYKYLKQDNSKFNSKNLQNEDILVQQKTYFKGKYYKNMHLSPHIFKCSTQ
jgi:hypothetical protein